MSVPAGGHLLHLHLPPGQPGPLGADRQVRGGQTFERVARGSYFEPRSLFCATPIQPTAAAAASGMSHDPDKQEIPNLVES